MAYQHSRRTRQARSRFAQQDNIDQQILLIHQAMGKKLLADHSYIPQVLATIEARYQAGKMRHGAYLFWSSLLEHIDEPQLFMQTLLEDSPQLKKYRRQTPLVGILTEQERQAALDEFTFRS